MRSKTLGTCPSATFPLSLFFYFLGAPYTFLGQAWAEGKEELATCRRRADSGRENRTKMYVAIV